MVYASCRLMQVQSAIGFMFYLYMLTLYNLFCIILLMLSVFEIYHYIYIYYTKISKEIYHDISLYIYITYISKLQLQRGQLRNKNIPFKATAASQDDVNEGGEEVKRQAGPAGP